jgi:branched-chain amino acid transport system substrate-binding protein
MLRQRGFRAGPYRVAYQSCDDLTAQTGIFDPGKCEANAKAYARNPDLVGVIGPFNSACALAQIPVANAAPGGPLAWISPSTSLTVLTGPDPLAPPDALANLYPTGRRNFARVVGSDAAQAAANAMLASSIGVQRVAVLHDGDVMFGNDRAVLFRRAARKLGLRVIAFRRWDPRAAATIWRMPLRLPGRTESSSAAGCTRTAAPSSARCALVWVPRCRSLRRSSCRSRISSGLPGRLLGGPTSASSV